MSLKEIFGMGKNNEGLEQPVELPDVSHAFEGLSMGEGEELASDIEIASSPEEPKDAPLYRVKKIIKNDKIENKLNHPGMIEAVRRNERQEFTISRRKRGGEIDYIVSEPMLKRGVIAEKVEPPESEATSEQNLKSWVRIEPERTREDKESKTEEARLDIQEVLWATDAPFELTLVATPTDKDKLNKIIRESLELGLDLEQTEGREMDMEMLVMTTGTMQSLKQDFIDMGVVKRDVVVGAEDEATARKLAQIVAGKSMPPIEELWMPGKEVYDSKEAALNAGAEDANSITDIVAFGAGINYPIDHKVPGVEVVEGYKFAAERRVPENEPSIKVAETVDDYGGRGELKLTDVDRTRHGIIIAGSGSGKTALIKSMAEETVVQSFEQVEQEGPNGAIGVVIIDNEKHNGGYNDLADRLKGMGLPDEYATVRRICPGQDEVSANINPFAIPGVPPKERGEAVVSILASRFGPGDEEAQRVFEKWAGIAINHAYKKLGWDPITGKPPKNIVGDLPEPNADQLMVAINDVISSSDFSRDTAGDVGTFVKGELEKAFSGLAGEVMSGGYDLDWNKVCSEPGVTVIELGAITDPDKKRILTNTVFRSLTGAIREKNGPSDEERLKMQIFIDEAGEVFDHSSTGKRNAHNLKLVRDAGVSVFAAVQGGLDRMHPDALDNMGNTFAMTVRSKADQEILAGRMGDVDPESMSYLTSMPDAESPEGRGIYYGRKMGEPVRFAAKDPRTAPKGEGRLTGPENIINLGPYQEAYSGDTLREAKDFLLRDPAGSRVRLWADVNAGLIAAGKQPIDIGGDLKDALTTMNETEPDLLSCSLTVAGYNATISRPDLARVAHRNDITRDLTNFMKSKIEESDSDVDFSDYELKINTGKLPRRGMTEAKDIVFAPDPMFPKGGFTLDNIVGTIAKEDTPKDAILQSFEVGTGAVLEAFKTGHGDNIQSWVNAVKSELLHNPNFQFTKDSHDFITDSIGKTVADVSLRAKREHEMRAGKQASPPPAQGAQRPSQKEETPTSEQNKQEKVAGSVGKLVVNSDD